MPTVIRPAPRARPGPRGVAAALVALALGSQPAPAQDIAMTPAQVSALGVRVERPARETEAEVLGLAAEVMVPNNQLFVVSVPLPGLVESVKVAVNESVRKGQLLARMQSSALAEAQRAWLQAFTQQQLARANLERDEQLAAEGLIAESRLLSTRAAHVEASALLSERGHALRLAGLSDAELERLQRGMTIGSTVNIVAPAAGVVVEQLAQAGQRLEAYTPLYRIARLDPLWLEIQVPMARAAGIREGAAVRVPAVEAAGRIISVGKAVTPQSQTIMLRALVDRNASRLRPGQYVEAAVALPASGAVRWRVPNAALARLEGRVAVFVPAPGGFRTVTVELLKEGPATSLVAGDIGKGVVVAGVAALKARLAGD